MLSILHRALKVARLSSVDRTVSALLDEYKILNPKGFGTTFINMVGMYKSKHTYSTKHLDQFYAVFGPLGIDCLAFAESLFDTDIPNFDCINIGKKLSHPFFENIRKYIKANVIRKLLSQQKLPDFLWAEQIEALVPGNYGDQLKIQKRTYSALLERFAFSRLPTSESKAKILAYELQNQYNECKARYEEPLLPLTISDENLELLKLLAVLNITDASSNQDLEIFKTIWGDGGVLFFTCLFFAKNQAKESNKDFWNEYAKWLKFEGVEDNTFQIQKFYGQIGDFWESYQIPYIRLNSRSTSFVFSFRMHAIVANRPLSTELIIKFLIRIISNSGTYLHDIEEQRELLERYLSDYSGPIIGMEDDKHSSYLQLPRETAYAFKHSREQVIDYLMPIYEYLERELIDRVTDGLTNYAINRANVPQFLFGAIDKALDEKSVEEIKRIRLAIKGQILKSSMLSLNLDEKRVSITVPVYTFTNKESSTKVTFQLFAADRGVIYENDNMIDVCIGSTLLTREISIQREEYYEKLTYRFCRDGEVLVNGKVFISQVYTMEGEPIRFPCYVAQPVLCLAKPDTIDADYLVQRIPNFLGEYNIWEVFLSETTPIFIGSTLYGIGNDFGQKKSGTVLGPSIYNQVSYTQGKVPYKVIGEYPSFFLRLNAVLRLEDAVKLIINGIEVPFSPICNILLEDGKGEAYHRFKVDSSVPFPNGALIQIRLFSMIEKKPLLEEQYFCLRNLNLHFSKEVYWGSDEVEIQHLKFDDMETLFKNNYYTFPNKNHKYRLSLDTRYDHRLVLHAPIVDIKAGTESILSRDFWYEELLEKGDIEVVLPQSFSVMKLFTVGTVNGIQNVVTHQLKRQGTMYRSVYLGQCPEIDDSYVTLSLIVIDSNKKKYHTHISKIYYKVSKKQEVKSEFLYIPAPSDKRLRNIKPGLEIKLAFYCGKNRDYWVTISGRKSRDVITGKLGEKGRFTYHQGNDLPADVYKIKVIERLTNRFIGKNTERDVCSALLNYKVLGSDAIVTQMPETSLRRTDDFEPSKESSPKKILITKSVKRVFKSGSAPSYENHIKIHPLYLEGEFKLSKNSNFSAKGNFFDMGGERIELSKNNDPFNVSVIEVNRDGSFILKIKDSQGAALRIGERKGFVNARQLLDKHEREIEWTLFLGKIVR